MTYTVYEGIDPRAYTGNPLYSFNIPVVLLARFLDSLNEPNSTWEAMVNDEYLLNNIIHWWQSGFKFRGLGYKGGKAHHLAPHLLSGLEGPKGVPKSILKNGSCTDIEDKLEGVQILPLRCPKMISGEGGGGSRLGWGRWEG